MSKLIKGTKITFTDGTSGTILKELGSGGQGIVYLIDYSGKQMAFKWYKKCPSASFVENLSENVKLGAPSGEFLWPLAISNGQFDSYGYLMELRPDGYYELSKFLLAKKRFKSDAAQIKAALSICFAFQKLHLKGLSYLDLNDGNFFIDPIEGNVLICDNDNVAPDKNNITHIRGKCRYMAPEVVKGASPDKFSDFFSLAIILFRLFFIDHPLEGKFNQSCPCLNEDFEKMLYGDKAVFIFDENDKSNAATQINKNAIKIWPMAPHILRHAFLNAFSKECMQNVNKRMTDGDWVRILIQMRSTICVCPICGRVTYIEKEDHGICKECKQKRSIYWIALGKKNIIPLVLGQQLYESQIMKNIEHYKVCAKVVSSKSEPNKIGIQNLSNLDWILTYNGQTKIIKKNEIAPILDNSTIKFGNINEGLIRQIKPQ